MGLRYTLFQVYFILSKKIKLEHKKYPTTASPISFVTLQEWKDLQIPYFFNSREKITITKKKNNSLQEYYTHYSKGNIRFFNNQFIPLGLYYDWRTNPDSNYTYTKQTHWLNIESFNPQIGDIKYVWEKSRFSYLLPLIRYDYHFDKDISVQIFNDIENWIDENPLNQGPNWVCSQEISLRILNWIFALNYYKNSTNLTEEKFQKIIHTIYWQLNHVYNNIHFSRIAVRNNHAITECMMLYLSKFLFPFIPETTVWSAKGKKWLEQELQYQIYDDGAFIQFSHNYHRVLIQLCTQMLAIQELNNDRFENKTIEKIKKTINFLYQQQDNHTGWLPNYGANDGALFFPLNDCHYRDYRPQLNALFYYFNNTNISSYNTDEENILEDTNWIFQYRNQAENKELALDKKEISIFENGGIFSIRKSNTFTALKCAAYKDRPSQCDNLHIDIWHNDINIFHDNGSYKYNTEPDILKMFNGNSGHNTIQLGSYDEMLKKGRFIYNFWVKKSKATIEKNNEFHEIQAEIKAYTYLAKNITIKRNVKIYTEDKRWIITDEVLNKPLQLSLQQHWHFFEKNKSHFTITSDGNEKEIDFSHSTYYGEKANSKRLTFFTTQNKITTEIRLK